MANNKCQILIRVLIFLFVISITQEFAFSQSTPEKFIKALVNQDKNLKEYVDADELARSERLGITYNGVRDKFLIGFDIDEQVKSDLKEGRMQYEISLRNLENDFTSAEFSVPQIKYLKTFYFKSGKFISPSLYFTRNWQTKSSKYFNFRISEPKYFNDYCIKRLDDFVDKIADTLGYTAEEKELLANKKIDYVFCKDENEVKDITGYAAKGQYILAFDEIISAYPTHFHELSHLLMNYKLKKLGLYTLPFFMEGFAVAMGGRGGMAPRVVTDVGYYLQKTGFLTYDSILTYNAFNSQDANMTYSVSGLYNMFLFSTLGAAKYLDLYKSVNGDLEFVKRINSAMLRDIKIQQFDQFLQQYENSFEIGVDEKDTLKSIPENRFNDGEFLVIKDTITVFIYNQMLLDLFAKTHENDFYESRKYKEIFPNSDFPKARYCFQVNGNEANVYNLYNDELVASYKGAFSLSGKLLPKKGNMYVFHVLRKVFDQSLLEHLTYILVNINHKN